MVVIGAVALLAAHLAVGRAWAGMGTAAVTLGVACAGLAIFDRRTIALVLVSGCLLPAIVWWRLETFGVQFWMLWLAALLGAMLPRLLLAPSFLGPRFRAPLTLALLAVVVATPLVILREIDFYPPLLGEMPGAVLSGLPWFSTEWILQVAVATLVTTLCFDWFVSTPGFDIERHAIAPLALTIGLSAVVAIYQMFVDVTFLNQTVYGGLGRAGGTMFDANVSGVLAAMGIGFAAYLASGGEQRRPWLALVPVFLLAVWASGSRTGLVAAAIVLTTSAFSWWRQSGAGNRNTPVNRRAIVAVAAVVIVLGAGALAALSFVDTTTVGPLQRFAKLLPGAGGQTRGAALAELWNRNGYGAAATWLIERYPLAGIGIGAFHLFGPPLTPVGTLPPDNAQNWLRHQVVEMGALGALGWVLFALVFAVFVLRRWRGVDPRLNHLRGVVLAFGVISLFGLPTQEAVPAVTFWVAAAALVRGRSGDSAAAVSAVSAESTLASATVHGRPLRPVTMAGILLVTVAFGVVTWQTATTRLRVPVRARQLGWPYAYGFYAPEGDPMSGAERWMADRATALVDIHGPFMRLSVRSPLPDTARQPVAVKVWSEGKLALTTALNSDAAATVTLPMPVGLKQVLLDIEVSRTVRPVDLDPSVHDERRLGALVSWTFAASGGGR